MRTVVDIDALVCALKTNHLACAAIDVFPREPKSQDEESESPLRGLENVILTPHVGGSTEEAQQNIGIEVVEKLIKYSNNGSTPTSVNFLEVSSPSIPASYGSCTSTATSPESSRRSTRSSPSTTSTSSASICKPTPASAMSSSMSKFPKSRCGSRGRSRRSPER